MDYTYSVKRRAGQKNLRIRINRQGEVQVSAPVSMSDGAIQKAVKSKENWIRTHLKKYETQQSRHDPLKTLLLGGRVFTVELRKQDRGRDRMSLLPGEGLCLVEVKDPARESVLAFMEKKLKKTAAEQLKPRADLLSKKTGIPHRNLYIRNQHTRWGSSSGRGNISINWRAIMLPPELQDYLLIHELCHQLHFDHSPAFWKKVEKHCPDWAERNRALKKYAPVMDLFR